MLYLIPPPLLLLLHNSALLIIAIVILFLVVYNDTSACGMVSLQTGKQGNIGICKALGKSRLVRWEEAGEEFGHLGEEGGQKDETKEEEQGPHKQIIPDDDAVLKVVIAQTNGRGGDICDG